MSWFINLFGKQEESGSIAKSRLQMVLTHDRGDISPGLMATIRDDIIAVIAHHLQLEPELVEVHLDQNDRESRLVAEVPLQQTGARRGRDR